MGVSGCGKSTIGRAVAERLGRPFLEGDEFHPERNVALMRAGTALTDADRWPWLDILGDALAGAGGWAVCSCSALRRAYRDHLAARIGRPLLFLHAHADRDVLLARMQARPGHFMPASLLDSQLATLEMPGEDEWCLTLPADKPVEVLVARAIDFVTTAGARPEPR
ncbi:gluconokinase [Novosphingobium flavum]|uniref:Gluconokinase n=2 Tax=Novosphingobium flavum TaxID=1778672 RepID=A0A7X1KKU2_9SPHN|nr:gluconokinase [Novosphingobium flavum]